MSHVRCLLLAPATSPVPLRRLPQLPVRGRRGRSIARGSRGRGGKTNGGRGRGGGDKGTSTGTALGVARKLPNHRRGKTRAMIHTQQKIRARRRRKWSRRMKQALLRRPTTRRQRLPRNGCRGARTRTRAPKVAPVVIADHPAVRPGSRPRQDQIRVTQLDFWSPGGAPVRADRGRG